MKIPRQYSGEGFSARFTIDIHVSTHGNTYCNETLCSGIISTGIACTSTEALVELLVTGVSEEIREASQ